MCLLKVKFNLKKFECVPVNSEIPTEKKSYLRVYTIGLVALFLKIF